MKVASGLADPRRVVYVLAVFAALVLFYVVTAPENRTESDDRFTFAVMLESKTAGQLVRDSRLMLFHTTVRALYVGLHGLGRLQRGGI